MSNETIKIYDSQDFERITKGVKVAYSSQAKSPDAKANTDKLDNFVTSATLSCSYCNTLFENKEKQRLHYKLDWHRYNLKQQLEGLKPISEQNFNILIKKDTCSSSESEIPVGCSSPSKKFVSKISESSSETTSQSDDSNESISETCTDDSQTENGDEKADDDLETKKDVVPSATSRRSKILFENQDGNFFSIYNCLLLHKKESIAEVNHDTILDVLTNKDKSLWTIIMVGSGHFAGAVFSDGKPVIHKTIHAYTVRAKQGSAQNSRDNKYSGTSKSAGANLRRANEAHFIQKVQELLKSWSAYLTSSSLILYRAVGPHNRSIFFGGKDAPLDKTDSRLRPLPFPTRKATFKEICRVHDLLNTIDVYDSATSYANDSPAAKRLSSKIRDFPTNSQSMDDLLNEESKDEDQQKVTSIENRTTGNDKKKNSRVRAEVVKPMKTQKRLLPDIVARLADIDLESDFASLDGIDDIQDLMESSMAIDLKDCLQEFENTPVPKSRSKARKNKKS